MPEFVEEHKEEHALQNESIASREDRYVEYQTLSEECKRDLPFKDVCETQYKTNPRGSF